MYTAHGGQMTECTGRCLAVSNREQRDRSAPENKGNTVAVHKQNETWA